MCATPGNARAWANKKNDGTSRTIRNRYRLLEISSFTWKNYFRLCIRWPNKHPTFSPPGRAKQNELILATRCRQQQKIYWHSAVGNIFCMWQAQFHSLATDKYIVMFDVHKYWILSCLYPCNVSKCWENVFPIRYFLSKFPLIGFNLKLIIIKRIRLPNHSINVIICMNHFWKYFFCRWRKFPLRHYCRGFIDSNRLHFHPSYAFLQNFLNRETHSCREYRSNWNFRKPWLEYLNP